jgi:hypothetical protein
VKNFISQAFLAISLIILTLAGGFGVGVSAQSDVNDRQERAEIADSPTLDFSTPPVDTYLLNDEGEKTPADLNTCATDSSGNLYCTRGNNFYSCRDVDNGPRGEDEYICNPVPLEGINSSSTEVEFSQAGRQATETYESRNNSRKFSATDIGVRVNNLGINGQVYDDLNGNCDSATDICRVECPAGGIQGACQEGEVIWMYECQNERSSNNTRVREFTCNKWAQFDGAQPTLADLDGSSESGDIETTNANDPSEKDEDNIFEFLFKIVMVIVASLLYVLSFAVLVILFMVSWFVLVLLGINPAGGEFLGAIQPAWGAVVGLANLLVLAAFMYIGFAYLLGLDQVKKNISDFILKIVYYALLLNFTLLGTAAFVNIGYGVGNLIKFAYAGDVSTGGTNRALAGDITESIGRISYIRCGNEFSNGDECEVDANPIAEGFERTGNLISLFAGDLADALVAVVSEALVIVAGAFALYVMFRVFKIVLLRLIGLIFIMILSPIGLASYFSPVDSWKEVGKQMLQRLWQFVAFYPAFIMALILVNLISGSFADIIYEADSTAEITQSLNADFQAPTTSSDSTEDNQATVGVVRTETLQNTFTRSIQVLLVLSLSLGGLWAVTEYFVKKFEEDLKKVTDGIQKAWENTKKGARFAGLAVGNVGRLASTIGNTKLFDYKGKMRGQALDRARELQRNKRRLKDENLSEEEKESILRRNSVLTDEIADYKDRAKYGLGRSIIKGGNTMAFGLENLEAGSKRVFDYMFKDRPESFKKENSVWWNTQMNRALKKSGIIDTSTADALTPDAVTRGVTAEMEQSARNDAITKNKRNPFDTLLEDRMEEERKKALGIGDIKLRQDVARSAKEYLISKSKGNIENLKDPEERRILEELIESASDDDSIARMLFSDVNGQNLVQQAISRGNISGGVLEKIGEKWGNVLGDSDSRIDFGRAVAGNLQLFRDVDAAVFNSDEVIRGYLEAGGDRKALVEKIGGSKMWKPPIVRAARDLVNETYDQPIGDYARISSDVANAVDGEGPQTIKEMQERLVIGIESGVADPRTPQSDPNNPNYQRPVVDFYSLPTADRKKAATEIFHDSVKAETGVDISNRNTGDNATKDTVTYVRETVEAAPIDEIKNSKIGKTIEDAVGPEIRQKEQEISNATSQAQRQALQKQLDDIYRREVSVRAVASLEQQEQYIETILPAAETIASNRGKVKPHKEAFELVKKGMIDLSNTSVGDRTPGATSSTGTIMAIRESLDNHVKTSLTSQALENPANAVTAITDIRNAGADAQNALKYSVDFGLYDTTGGLANAHKLSTEDRNTKLKGVLGLQPNYWEANGYAMSPSEVKKRSAQLTQALTKIARTQGDLTELNNIASTPEFGELNLELSPTQIFARMANVGQGFFRQVANSQDPIAGATKFLIDAKKSGDDIYREANASGKELDPDYQAFGS